jgi:chloramphenicol 3-O phosphotransferase
MSRSGPGRIVVLNGAPRSGKTSIGVALQERARGVWINLGVDLSRRSLPKRYQPGIGLRPGGERPDLEDLVVTLYESLYESVAAHARLGLDVVVDVGHHDDYSQHRDILRRCARVVEGLPVLFVGVRCPLEEIWRRREATWKQNPETADDELVRAVERWQKAVHAGVSYDMEVDTSMQSPEQCAELVTERLEAGPAGVAFGRLVGR